jgi:phosphoenolpyruvate-protein kinase (PTS system EI component)
VPNYVTRKKVRAQLIGLDSSTAPDVDLAGKIILIPNADPGFDWIFSRDIAGLITMYGGANSHMAIRMAEFQLPGVTGIGSMLFEQIRNVQVVELDCLGRQIRIVR